MKAILTVTSLTISLFFASCSSQELISTYSQKIIPNNDLMFRYYDSKTKIRYDFRNDDSLFYVILETDNKASQTRIFRNGVKICLSSLPIKNDKRYVLYPNPESVNVEKSQTDESSQDNAAKHHSGGNHSLANISKLALWDDNGQQQTFMVGLDKTGFDYFLNYDKDGFLHYEAKISLYKLKMNTADSTTVVGVKIGTLEVPQSGGMRNGGGGMGGGRMGGGSMGGGGMRGGGGDRGMQNGGGGNYHSNMDGADEKIDWWFKLKIK